jgi:hypothetical protein
MVNIEMDEARRIALGDEPIGRSVTYGDGWIFWREGAPERLGDGATIVDRQGRSSAVLSFELHDLAAAVARHHGVTVEVALERYPELDPGVAPERDPEVPSWAADAKPDDQRP